MEILVAAYRKLVRIGAFLLPAVLLLIRLAWGWELVQSGWGHLHHIPEMVAQFREWHIPAPEINVRMSATVELVGGILWMLGLATRPISLILFFNFCVALATASHDKLVNIFHEPTDVVDDSAFPFLVASLLLVALGAGILSIDGLLKRTVFRRQMAETNKT